MRQLSRDQCKEETPTLAQCDIVWYCQAPPLPESKMAFFLWGGAHSFFLPIWHPSPETAYYKEWKGLAFFGRISQHKKQGKEENTCLDAVSFFLFTLLEWTFKIDHQYQMASHCLKSWNSLKVFYRICFVSGNSKIRLPLVANFINRRGDLLTYW